MILGSALFIREQTRGLSNSTARSSDLDPVVCLLCDLEKKEKRKRENGAEKAGLLRNKTSSAKGRRP